MIIILRSMEDPFKDFEIPLTEKQYQAFEALLYALGQNADVEEFIHPAALSLFTSNRKEASSESLYCALSRCILITTLSSDGRFNSPDRISPIYTGHQYWIRLTAAYEINERARMNADEEIKLVSSII